MKKTELYIKSTNNENNLHTIVWEPEGDIEAIVQISHGMIEYIDRYDRSARFLNSKGILVVGNDHLGHGLTAKDDDELGYFPTQYKSKTVVDDLYEITKEIKSRFGEEIPYFARIAAIADTFDAMTSKRSYRDSLPLDVVINEFKRCRGTQFDPKLDDVFLDILENHYDEIEKIKNNY